MELYRNFHFGQELSSCDRKLCAVKIIPKITNLNAVPNEGIEGVAETLEQLWISYNKIEKLAPLAKMTKIRTLYMAHNNVKYEVQMRQLKLKNLILNIPGLGRSLSSFPTFQN